MAKRPRDVNQLAKLMVDIASGEAEDMVSAKMKSPASVRGRAGGLKGGNARSAALSREERTRIATDAAKKRWKAS